MERARRGVAPALVGLAVLLSGTHQAGAGSAEAARELLVAAEDLARRGDLQGAIASASKALEEVPAEGQPGLRAAALAALGDYYGSVGNLARALEYRERGAEAYALAGDREAQSRVLQRLGYIYDRVGETGKALLAEKKAYALILRLGDPLEKAVSLTQQGVYTLKLGREGPALDLFTTAVEIAGEHPEDLRAAWVLWGLPD